jgi:GNAT superfamily N-acetyltransferase
MPLTLRPAQNEDILLLVNARLDFLRALGYDIQPDEENKAAQQIETYLSDHLERDLFAWIALEDQTLAAAGFLQVIEVMWQPMAPRGRYGRIINILTWPPFRHQGLARAIMLELIRKARELDLAYLDLDASPEGQPLYESLGFALIHPQHPPMRLILK